MHKYTPPVDEYFCDGCGVEIFYLERDWKGMKKERQPNTLTRLVTGWRQGETFYHKPYGHTLPDFVVDLCPRCSKHVVAFVKQLTDRDK